MTTPRYTHVPVGDPDRTLAQPAARRGQLSAQSGARSAHGADNGKAISASKAMANKADDDDKTLFSPTPAPTPKPSNKMRTSGSGRFPALDPNASLIGQYLGPVKIIKKLGQGGMGQVFLGHDENLDINVAVKVLPQHFANERDFFERFLREARAVAKLDHPNVVRVLRVDEQSGVNYLVMDYVDGQDISSMIRAQGKIPLMQALTITRAAADALRYAHKQGIVHRDIKPHNILVSKDGQKIKVADFGLAKLAEDQQHMTMSGQILGTPHYMSPEQAEGAANIDGRTDTYSLGVSLYHMLTGTVPFNATSPTAVIYQLVNNEMTFPEEHFGQYPADARNLINGMCSKDPDARFPLDDVVDYLDTMIDEVKSGAAKPAAAAGSVLSDKRKLALYGGIGAGALVLIVIVLAIALGDDKDQQKKSGPTQAQGNPPAPTNQPVLENQPLANNAEPPAANTGPVDNTPSETHVGDRVKGRDMIFGTWPIAPFDIVKKPDIKKEDARKHRTKQLELFSGLVHLHFASALALTPEQNQKKLVRALPGAHTARRI